MDPGPGMPTALPRRSSTRRTVSRAGGATTRATAGARTCATSTCTGACAPRRPDRFVERRNRDPGFAGRAAAATAAVGCFVRLSVTLMPSASNVPRATAAWTRQVRRILRRARPRPPITLRGAVGAAGAAPAGAAEQHRAQRGTVAPPRRCRVLIMSPPCWRLRRSCLGPIRGAAACSGSTTACTGGTARSAGGRPAPASRCVVGAILTQNAAWRNAERAIERLREAGAPRPSAPCSAWRRPGSPTLLRPSGTFRLKARGSAPSRRHVARRHGQLGAAARAPAPALRAELRGIAGDRARRRPTPSRSTRAGRPIFVVDAYTRRILARHRLVAAGRRTTRPFRRS